jgi:hypothetical protein
MFISTIISGSMGMNYKRESMEVSFFGIAYFYVNKASVLMPAVLQITGRRQ